MEQDSRSSRELNALLASYRATMPDFDGSPEFMPALWGRIEQRRQQSYSFRRLASGFVTAAAAICLMMSFALWSPSNLTALPAPTYVDVVADGVADVEIEQAEAL